MRARAQVVVLKAANVHVRRRVDTDLGEAVLPEGLSPLLRALFKRSTLVNIHISKAVKSLAHLLLDGFHVLRFEI